ncbi:MAG: D-aminoacylase [Sphingomonadales bacterium]|nr:MAG: D-aminoacylase [Sphingomonadales bacterium]
MIDNADIVVRGGLIVDGTGRAPFEADIAIAKGRILAIGENLNGREEIDARGLHIMPGFVDIHTHYDGHATWSERLGPSAPHGVTTVVMGNCGVGFAPCRPQDRDRLVKLMEGVEDIPDVVISAGLPWSWQGFPEYLDLLETRQYDMDVAAYIPHAPLRVFVMGDRALNREPATSEDIAHMAQIAREAVEAGALGFSTSRSLNHRSSDGRVTPSYDAAEVELDGIAASLKEADAGIVQFISDFDDPELEFAMMRRVLERSGRPATMSLLQSPAVPERWRHLLAMVEAANREGVPMTAQVSTRPVGMLFGLELSYHPFSFCPAYQSIAGLNLADRLHAMRQPATRERLLAEFGTISTPNMAHAVARLDSIFLMADPPSYEPTLDESVDAVARRNGLSPAAYAYDLLTEGDGRSIFYSPVMNYVDGSAAAVGEMLRHPDTVLGLGDGGAHCGIVCDASLQTHTLIRWTQGDDALPIETIVRFMTMDTARAVGIHDRGTIQAGMRADLNLVDMDGLGLHRPEMVYDLPTGAGRLHQRAKGFVATMVAGEITYRSGVATGALPGRLLRRQRAVAPLRSAPADGVDA